MSRIIQFIDWAARVHFVGTLCWTVGGWAVTFFGLSAAGWDAGAVWLGSLVAGACVAVMFIAHKARIISAGAVAATLSASIKLSPNAPTTPDQKSDLIVKARQLVIDATAQDGVRTDFRTALEGSAVYLQLRPYLSDAFLESVRNAGRTFFIPPAGSNLPGLAHMFLSELDRIERAAPAARSDETEPVERDMTMTECFRTLNDASPYPVFEDSLYQALYDGSVSAWGRQQIGRFEEDGRGPYHLIEKNYWKIGRLQWTTIGPSGTERTTHKDEQDCTGIMFNSAQIRALAAQIGRQRKA